MEAGHTSHGHNCIAGVHSHHGMDRRLWATAALNMAIAVVEILGGVFSGSMALLSDATHNVGDLVAVLLALFARRLSRRPPTPRHTYGLKRVEVMAALINAMLLIGATVFIAREAVHHLLHPSPVARGIMLVVALVALGANAASVFLLRHHDHDDVNVRSAFLHMAQDAFASVAVVIAALLAHTAAGAYVDSVAALVVSLLVMRSALSLAWQTTSTILEGVPQDVDIAELADRVGQAFAPACLHHVHVWEIGPQQRLLTAHLALGQEMDGRAIEAILARIKLFLHDEWKINHATIEPEIAGCPDANLLGQWEGEGGKHHGRPPGSSS
jgi:cobalt-zinc-cadmium efflux system protein